MRFFATLSNIDPPITAKGGLAGPAQCPATSSFKIQWCRKGKKFGGPVVMGEHNLPSPGWNRVNWSAKYWGARVPPAPVPAWPVAPRFRHHWNRLHYANGSFFNIQLPLFFFKWNAFSVLFLFYSTGKFSNRLTQNLFNFWLFTVNPVHFMLSQCSRSLYEFAL